LENLKERAHLGDLDADGSIISKGMLKKQCVWMRNGFIWLRMQASGELL
jgi:hypothetical protein